MTTQISSSNVLLQLIFIALIQGFEAQHVKVSPEVTAYLGHDVTLPCKFIHTSKAANITQVEWYMLQPDGEKSPIIVDHQTFGPYIHDSFLKERIDISQQSLIIKNVNMKDAGLYLCKLTIFPHGVFDGATKVIVREQVPISKWVLSAIVTTAVLLLVILTVVLYLCVIRKCRCQIGRRVVVDPAMAMRDKDVIYSDVMVGPDRHGTPSSSDKRRVASHADNVLYSEVIISPRQSR